MLKLVREVGFNMEPYCRHALLLLFGYMCPYMYMNTLKVTQNIAWIDGLVGLSKDFLK